MHTNGRGIMKKAKETAPPNVRAFCKEYGLTEAQFYGSEKYGGDLDLSSLTSKERKKVSVNKPEPNFGSNLRQQICSFREKMTWENGKFISVDGVFSEVMSNKGNIYRIRQIGKERVEYLVTDNKGKWAHGSTLKEARADLIYRIADRDTS